MRVIAIIAGLLALFFVSQKSEIKKSETESTFKANVCFEQRAFDYARELENTENTPVLSIKEFSRNDKKRNTDSINRFTCFSNINVRPELKSISVDYSSSKLFFNSGQSQSLLQVFLL